MRILIVEDEHYAVKRLTSMIMKELPDANILAAIDNVEETCEWLASHVEPDLIFMDIQLADGLSFQIFDRCKVKCPVIFTTAYDEYALEAFKVNSIDYILKPLEEAALKQSLEKYRNLVNLQHPIHTVNWQDIGRELLNKKEKYKQRFLIKTGSTYSYLQTSEIDLIYSDDGLSFAINNTGKRCHLDKSLDKIEPALDPDQFFRISRKYIIRLESILKIHPYLNNRMKIEMTRPNKEDLVVSREKVKSFKEWLDK